MFLQAGRGVRHQDALLHLYLSYDEAIEPDLPALQTQYLLDLSFSQTLQDSRHPIDLLETSRPPDYLIMYRKKNLVDNATG